MDAMNVQSSSTGLDDLIFYIVPAIWYRKLWRLVLRPLGNAPADWREQIGGLPPVIEWWEKSPTKKAVPAEQHPATQQNGLVLQELHSVWKRDKTTTAGKHPQKTHEKDYYFVGKNAWTVLQNKFGTADNTGIPCHCVSFPSQDSRLAVNLPDGTRIPISGSGRFAYEESLMKEEDAEEVVRVGLRLLRILC
jgi:hypothetical protein